MQSIHISKIFCFFVLAILVAGNCHAQTPSVSRVALVIGNAAYTSAPLQNPRNDAKGMASLLTEAGFDVDQVVDASQQSLRVAVERFGRRIRNENVRFAVFYYAGHGIQLDWRNYLIPVDAQLRSAADVKQQSVEVSELLRYMQETKSRSFLVILDACRDNPFEGSYATSGKGLSQFDAPVGSLIAFSTSPGNVAQDGDGSNGLYTGHLLREFSIRNARVEDAFKRVRLNVRVESGGRQIPWESTSLEDDLYLFPSEKKKLNETEREAAFEREIKAWMEVKAATQIDPLVAFLREYPSGNTSELAQSRLNRILLAQAEAKARQEAVAQAALMEQQRIANAESARKEQHRIAQMEAMRLEQQRKSDAEMQQRMQLAAAVARESEAQSKHEREQQIALAAQREAQERERLKSIEAADKQAALKQQDASRQTEQKTGPMVTIAIQPTVGIVSANSVSTATVSALAQAPNLLPPLTVSATPFYKGMNVHLRNYSVGDEYAMQLVDMFTKATKPLVFKVSRVDMVADRVEFNNGEYVSDLMGNIAKNVRGSMDAPRQFYPSELHLGKKWQSRFRQSRPSGHLFTFEYEVKVVSKEKITVPAGTFEAYRLEAKGFNVELGASIQRTIWVTPGINADIAHETLVRLRNGTIDQWDRQELVGYKAQATSVVQQ